MIQAYDMMETGFARVQKLIKQVHAVSGRYDLIAFVESPDLQSLGN